MGRVNSVNDVEELIFFEDVCNISFIVTSSATVWTDQTSGAVSTCPDF
jgi:hypothetical protein